MSDYIVFMISRAPDPACMHKALASLSTELAFQFSFGAMLHTFLLQLLQLLLLLSRLRGYTKSHTCHSASIATTIRNPRWTQLQSIMMRRAVLIGYGHATV
jgi:hypothetical protein